MACVAVIVVVTDRERPRCPDPGGTHRPNRHRPGLPAVILEQAVRRVTARHVAAFEGPAMHTGSRGGRFDVNDRHRKARDQTVRTRRACTIRTSTLSVCQQWFSNKRSVPYLHTALVPSSFPHRTQPLEAYAWTRTTVTGPSPPEGKVGAPQRLLEFPAGGLLRR